MIATSGRREVRTTNENYNDHYAYHKSVNKEQMNFSFELVYSHSLASGITS